MSDTSSCTPVTQQSMSLKYGGPSAEPLLLLENVRHRFLRSAPGYERVRVLYWLVRLHFIIVMIW